MADWLAWTEIYDLDGRNCGTLPSLHAVKERVAEGCGVDIEQVRFDDRYDADGACVEFVVVEGIGDVGTLDRPVPSGWVEFGTMQVPRTAVLR